MPLAAILGIYLLLTWPRTTIVFSVPATVVWQSPPSQEYKPNNSTPQGSSAQPSAAQQKAPEKSATPQDATAPPCPDSSQHGSTGKTDCKAAKATAKTTKHPVHKTGPPAATPAQTGPPKKVVPNGGTEDAVVDLSPRRNQEQSSQQSEKTKQLLAASDLNLNKISGRQLTPTQQDTVKQIKSYMEQSRNARDDGDVQRAYNLALKANLLSAELVGH
jgi:hypothetical protein